jgi:hypothetical protein
VPSSTPPPSQSLWDDDEEPVHSTPPPAATPSPRSSGAHVPANEPEFEMDEAADENVPLVATELVGAMTPASNPFEDVYFSTPGPGAIAETEMNVPTMSIEIPLPQGILESLPVLGEQPATITAPLPAQERRANDGLVKEVSIPLNLSMDELRRHRRLRLKITLDVNLLP